MSKRGSDNSLERELDYEDVTIWAGESSKARRQLSSMERALYANNSMVLDAAESSRSRRLKLATQGEESSAHDSSKAKNFSSGGNNQDDGESAQFGSGQYEANAAVEETKRSSHGSHHDEGPPGQTRDVDDGWPQLSQQQQTPEEESQRQYDTKEAMLNAGNSSRTRRRHRG